MSEDYRQLPPDLPVPSDDGAADHLEGMALPPLRLATATGGEVDLAELGAGLLVVYVYPRTGVPGQPSPPGWDDIPGARGCTPQNCAYRDAAAEFAALGAELAGLSSQDIGEQRDFAAREHIPYPLLNDTGLALAERLRLPTFEVEGMTLYRRLTFIARAGRIVKTFYPVFPPDSDSAQALGWLRAPNDLQVHRVVDVMNVIGSRPDGWWHDRIGAIEHLVARLDRWAETHGERVTAMLEGPPQRLPEVERVAVEWPPQAGANSADHEIVRRLPEWLAEAEAGGGREGGGEVVVVTSDRDLAARVRAAGAEVESSRPFRTALDAL